MERSNKILVVAGEASGDRLAGRALAHAIAMAAQENNTLDLFGIGGGECLRLGMECLYSVDEMSIVGFAEVAKRYRFFRSVLQKMVSLLDTRRPDVVFLVDYPGFNLRLAKEAKKRGIRVVFYVSPQVWAWKASRVRDIVSSVSDMLVIFPFEVEIYQRAGLERTYFVGHPLLEIIEEERRSFHDRNEFARQFGLDAGKSWLLLFPGSRKEEVRRHLEIMKKAAEEFCAGRPWQPVIVEASSVPPEFYSAENSNFHCFRSSDHNHELMFHAQLGILKSGTTTLEAALMGLPGVICYKTSVVTYQIAKKMITLDFIGLANIVLGKKLYPELIQSDFTARAISKSVQDVEGRRENFTQELKNISAMLRSPHDSPSRRVAEILLSDG